MASSFFVGVDGIARSGKAINVGVDGIARNVSAGFVGVDGIARQFFASGKTLSEIALGASVYLPMTSTSYQSEFVVVRYDSDGVWLMQKVLTDYVQYSSSDWDVLDYEYDEEYGDEWIRGIYPDRADIHVWMNGTFKSRIASPVREKIIGQITGLKMSVAYPGIKSYIAYTTAGKAAAWWIWDCYYSSNWWSEASICAYMYDRYGKNKASGSLSPTNYARPFLKLPLTTPVDDGNNILY